MTTEIRPCTEAELEQFVELTGYVFADNRSDERRLANPQTVMRPEWTTCAFVDGRLATSFAAFPFRVRWNGARAAMAGVTAVGTWPEFRRRGLLRQVMMRSLADQRERGQSIAGLWASFAAIYQRFGYAPIAPAITYEIEPTRLSLLDAAPPDGSATTVETPAGARDTIAAIHRECLEPRTLGIERAGAMWDRVLTAADGERLNVAVHRDDGRATGYLVYRLRDDDGAEPGAPNPNQRIDVVDHAYLDVAAWAGLWRFLLAHDLVDRATIAMVAPDDPAPLLVDEPRQLRRLRSDAVYLRIVDVAEALRARPFAHEGVVTIEVIDELCDWNGGRYAIESDGSTTEVTGPVGSTKDPAGLTVDVRSLALLASGAASATELVVAGLARDVTPASAPALDRFWATTHKPWCQDHF